MASQVDLSVMVSGKTPPVSGLLTATLWRFGGF
jgi:hypothetical protein